MRSFIPELVCAAQRGTLSLVLMLISVAAIMAQPPDSYWYAAYGTSSTDRFSEVRETGDFGLVIAGYTNSVAAHGYDFWLVKTDVAGQQLWSQTYGGTHDDICYALEIAPDGGCILAGYTNYYPDNGQAGWVIKTDMNGNLLWSREMGRAGYSAFFDVAITNDGGIILGGYQSNGTWLVKLSADGDSLWSRTFGGASGTGIAVCKTQDGGFAVSGQVFRGSPNNYDYTLLKTNANGDSLWTRTFGTPAEDRCRKLIETSDGNLILGGYGGGFTEWEPDMWMVKASASGDSLWSHSYNYPVVRSYDYCMDLQQTWEGGFILAGWTQQPTNWISNFWIVRVNATGDTLWTRTYGGAASDVCNSVRQLYDGGYAFAGYTDSYGHGGNDGYLIRTTPDHILPVELAAFDVAAEVNGIRVNFRTASEINTDHFEILRSESPSEGFMPVVSLPSQGSNSSGHAYSYRDESITTGVTYWYYLVDVALNGERTEHRDMMRSMMATDAPLSSEYTLAAYPNPFNATTTLSFSLTQAGVATLAIFNANGQWMCNLVNKSFGAGHHAVTFDARDLSSGIYFARLSVNDFVKTEKMVLLR